LFVDNDEDWAVMNGPDKTDLVCPDCDLRLTPKTRKNRYLSHLPGASCDHGLPRSGGGGPMSPEHAWFQRRLATICRLQGHPAEIEHGLTNADVYVADARLVIEVQRWTTEFEKRTAARRARGDRVIWFVPTT
jgi:competence CoiA-like predicted nuclease